MSMVIPRERPFVSSTSSRKRPSCPKAMSPQPTTRSVRAPVTPGGFFVSSMTRFESPSVSAYQRQ
jgi:hypothetical protein